VNQVKKRGIERRFEHATTDSGMVNGEEKEKSQWWSGKKHHVNEAKRMRFVAEETCRIRGSREQDQ